MSTRLNGNKHWWIGFTGAVLFAALPFVQGCAPESIEDEATEEAPSAEVDSNEAADDHDDDDHGHEHAAGDEDLTTVDGLLHAIAKAHETIKTASSDAELLEVHHAPFEIHGFFATLKPMLELSEEDAKSFDDLHGTIDQKANLIEDASHEGDVPLVRALVEKLNVDIETLEKLVAPDHVH